MKPLVSYLAFCFLTCLSFHGYSYASQTQTKSRTFSYQINPGCESVFEADCSKYTNMSLVHITSDGDADTLHFIWSFIGAPSLLMARTSLNTNVSIDWATIISDSGGAIQFEPQPFYVFGWSLVKVLVYNDRNDTGRIDNQIPDDIEGYDSKNFEWMRLDNSSTLNATMIKLRFEARSYNHLEGEGFGSKDMGPDGFFRIAIRMKNTEDYSNILPYMMYNENSTQVDFAFNNVQLNTSAEEYPKHPRIAFKYILVQDNWEEGQNTKNMKLEVSKTLDDEHSPGVFEVYSVRTPSKKGAADQSYMQWKPICYTAEVRDVADSVDVIAYPIRNTSSLFDDNIHDSILWSYFGTEIDNVTLDTMTISFGTQGDGFYNKTKHISWTYSTGFGVPPRDRVSMLVMLVVSIGLGIPTLIIVFSVFYMTMCRNKRPRDDLLLSQ